MRSPLCQSNFWWKKLKYFEISLWGFEERIVEQLRTEKLIMEILIVFNSSGSDKKAINVWNVHWNEKC